jgi:hypothetical protein
VRERELHLSGLKVRIVSLTIRKAAAVAMSLQTVRFNNDLFEFGRLSATFHAAGPFAARYNLRNG